MKLEVPWADAELAADALWQGQPSAVGEAELGGGRVRLTADVADVDRIPGPWADALVRIGAGDDRYLDAWRSWAAPLRAGRRIVVHPAWLDAPGAPTDDLVIVLDPGRAFGSGSHVSTRLALAAVEEHVTPGDRVLDVGCGSGVLSVAACLLGAAGATAIDVDAGAVAATRDNADRNGVADRVDASERTLSGLDGVFDLVVANIGLAILRYMAPDLEARRAPSGLLVLGGLLEEQADEMAAACATSTEVAREGEDGWVSLLLRSRG